MPTATASPAPAADWDDLFALHTDLPEESRDIGAQDDEALYAEARAIAARLAEPLDYPGRDADEQMHREIQAEIAAREQARPWRSPADRSSGGRSVADHAARVALHEAALRELYHRGEAAIAGELLREVSRAGGALAGGWAGATAGAEACWWGGTWGMGVCGAIGGVAGAFLGGEAGEEVADWVIDELYPPSETRIEEDGA